MVIPEFLEGLLKGATWLVGGGREFVLKLYLLSQLTLLNWALGLQGWLEPVAGLDG